MKSVRLSWRNSAMAITSCDCSNFRKPTALDLLSDFSLDTASWKLIECVFSLNCCIPLELVKIYLCKFTLKTCTCSRWAWMPYNQKGNCQGLSVHVQPILCHQLLLVDVSSYSGIWMQFSSWSCLKDCFDTCSTVLIVKKQLFSARGIYFTASLYDSSSLCPAQWTVITDGCFSFKMAIAPPFFLALLNHHPIQGQLVRLQTEAKSWLFPLLFQLHEQFHLAVPLWTWQHCIQFILIIPSWQDWR